jgi:hypothetical protein
MIALIIIMAAAVAVLADHFITYRRWRRSGDNYEEWARRR